MLRPAVVVVAAFAALPLFAQSPAPPPPPLSRLENALPPGVRATQLVVTHDSQRVYFSDSARALWLYVRGSKTSTRLADGEVWDLTISPTDNLLAYRRVERESGAQHVWLLGLDARTGLTTGRERRVSALEGDAPSISPDGKWVAFAHDDSIGVGQSVIVAPTGTGRERTIVSRLPSSVGNIRWSPDGKTLFFGVNPPVRCDPDWSCLALKPEFQQVLGTVRRVPLSGGAAQTVATRVGGGWPGLSPDGSLLVYSDTGFPSKLVVADSAGRTLRSFRAPQRQTIEGWVPPSTLVFSDRGDVQKMNSYSLADGSSRALSITLPQLSDPAWSPNGQVFSTADCVGDTCRLRLWSSDGASVRSIQLPDLYNGGAAWSPDGSRIVYASGPPNGNNGNRHFSVLDVETGRVQQLPSLPSANAGALWAADSRALVLSIITGGTGAGRKVIFQRMSLDSSVRTIRELVIGPTPSTAGVINETTAIVLRNSELHHVVFDGDSSDKIAVAKTDGRYIGFYAVSPGGERVAFRHSRKAEDDVKTIEVLASDGRQVATIDTPFWLFGGPNTMRFLPGGNQLVVLGGPREQDTEPGVYLVNVDTKESKRLISIPPRAFTGDIALSADGRTLLYVLGDRGTPRVSTMDLSPLKVRK